MYLSLLFVALTAPALVYGQADTLTLSPGSSGGGVLSVTLSISSPSGSEPAGIDWAITFPATDVFVVSASAGPSLTAAGKALNCAIDSGLFSCAASGMNSNIISNGVVATVNITLAVGVVSTTATLSGADGADPTGSTLSFAGLGTASGGGGTAGGGSGGGTAGLPISSLTCTPTSIAPGQSTTCTVNLASAAASGGNPVALVGGDYFSIPSSFSVVAGSSTGTFTAVARTGKSPGTYGITANSGGSSATASISITGSSGFFSISCSPATLAGGDSSACTITLGSAAPSGGASVTLLSSNSAVVVPASVTIAAGATSANVTATTSAVASSQTSAITATYSSASQTGNISVVPAVPLSSVTCTLPTVSGSHIMGSSSSATCALNLTGPANAGQSFIVTSNSRFLTAPASVNVPAGSATGSFSINSGKLSSSWASVTLTAKGYGATQAETFKVALLVSSVSCNPNAIAPPFSTNTSCTITLTQSLSGATVVTLTNNSSGRLTTPASVTVPGGSTSSTFSVTASPADYYTAVITATLNGIAQSGSFTVGMVPPKSVTCTPTKLAAGQTGTCNFTLVAPAPAGGDILYLFSSSPLLSIPVSVSVAAGLTTGSFRINALTGYLGPVVVTIRGSGIPATATISSAVVRPKPGVGRTPMTGLTCTPKLAQPGDTVSCVVQLNAELSSAELPVSASDASVHVPTFIQGRQHQSTISFQAVVDKFAVSRTVSIQVGVDDSSADELISVIRSGPSLAVPSKQFAVFGKRLSFQVTSISDNSSGATISASSLPAGAHFDPVSGTFDWTPDQAEQGTFEVRFSAVDTSGRADSASVSIQTGSGMPVLDSLENAASGATDRVCSSGSLGKVRGGWLSPYPRVIVNDAPVAALTVSPTEITFACPAGEAGSQLSVAVETDAGRSAPLTTALTETALGVFTTDDSTNGQAAATTGSLLAAPRNFRFRGQPSQRGDYLEIPVTGITSGSDPELISVQVGGLQIPAESIRSSSVRGIVTIGVTLPRAAPAGDAIPLAVQRRLADGANAMSQQTTIAIEDLR